MGRLFAVFTALTTLIHGTGVECPSFDTVSSYLLTPARKERGTVPSEACLCSLLVQSPQRTASTVVPLIQAFARYTPVSDTLLFCAWRQKQKREFGSVFAAVLHAWKQHHPSLNAALLRFQQTGAVGKIDTLCRIFDREGELDVILLLRWIEAKQILDDYAPVPGLLCRVISGRPELTPIALNHFESILDEVATQRIDTLMGHFIACAFSGPKTDTNAIRSWVIDLYGRKQLFDRQLELLSALEKNTSRKCEHLQSIALQRFRVRQFTPAAAAAKLLYNCSSERKFRQDAASLLYQIYHALGMNDSAKIWLELAGVTSENSRCEAIELYQQLGDYSKAAGLIHLLPESLARDTLHLKQLLLCDSLSAALRFVSDSTTALARSAYLLLLWRVRIAFYSGKTDRCLALLDSNKVNPTHPYASEFMEYRYWLLRLADSPEALAKFIQIEYTLFKGDREKAARLLCSAGPMGGNAWRIALRIARRQIDNSEAAAAVSTLRCAPAEGEPEYLYRLAEAQLRDGTDNEAKTVLERLIVEFPGNLYTIQGRLLLSQLP